MIDKAKLASDFWLSHDNGLFDQKTIAAVIGCSSALLERRRWAGNSIPFRKLGRKCMYKKSDVIAWLDQHQAVQSTSQYEESNDVNI